VQYGVQTTSGSHTSVLVATIPLPGTGGDIGGTSVAVPSKGQLDLDYDVSITGTTTTVAARFKGYISYTVQTEGSPVAVGNAAPGVQPIAYGTNSIAVPAGWTCVISLDGASENILIKVTTDGSDTYSVSALTQQKYTQ
jgi:hypothetical protein